MPPATLVQQGDRAVLHGQRHGDVLVIAGLASTSDTETPVTTMVASSVAARVGPTTLTGASLAAVMVTWVVLLFALPVGMPGEPSLIVQVIVRVVLSP